MAFRLILSDCFIVGQEQEDRSSSSGQSLVSTFEMRL